ncbi:ATP-binding protein [Halanaerobium sp.]|uniref:ATP-binding protein n=1 Tax=Halanaerobium sp. TaxID=1895664 RepID=UPI000DE5C4B4|nr:ATP-binding protein [Halanaerobium sp.]PUU90489.1 MAG: ATP-dependent OLD family endonuclease [Halanaerobium sp.]
MILKKLMLKNFRGYKNATINFDANLNVVVGKNDVGKSTILEALEIFFNADTVKPEIEDLCVTCEEPQMRIGVVFDVNKDREYLVDSANRTNLNEEFLLNENNELEIHKVWDCSKDKLTKSSMTAYLIANYINEFKEKPLITLKISALREELNKFEDKIENYDEVNKKESASIRNALYSSVENKECSVVEIPLNKEDGKKLFKSIESEFPLFFLFQSDRANKDSDKEVQDPLKAITKKAIAEVESDLEAVREKIQSKAISLGDDTLEKLKEMSPDIASILKPNIKNKPWHSLFSFSFESDEGIPMNKRGSGVRRLIILNYFRAEADRANTGEKNIIYAIEEPETSQHPDHQVMLIEALMELGRNSGKQVIITTHTPEIAKLVSEENLILVKKVDNNPVSVDGDEKLNEIVNTLGLLPYYGKVVVCVEGNFDVLFLRNLNRIKDFREIINLEKEKISIIPMIGSNLKNWAEKNYLENSNVVEFHLYDKDDNSQYSKSVDKINKRDDKSVALLTNYREMENYIHPELIKDEFDFDTSEYEEAWSTIDVPKLVSDIKPGLKQSDIKRIINGKVAKNLTSKHLRKLGVYNEVKSWFEKIKELNSIC